MMPRVDLGRFRIMEMRVEYVADSPYYVIVRVHMTVGDLERPGQLTQTKVDKQVSAFDLEHCSPEQHKAFVHNLLRVAVLHELDECLLFDGKRYRDPHPELVPSPQG